MWCTAAGQATENPEKENVMGYARSPAPHVIDAAKVISFVGESEIAAVFNAFDPFGLDPACEFGPNGRHTAIGSCGDVVCCHCSRIFWN